jgi:hypothetical protein
MWVGFTGLWFLFVYQLSLIELAAGAAAAALTVVALQISFHAVPLRFRPEARWLSQAFMLPATVVKDMVVLLRALTRLLSGRKIHSLFQVTHFPAIAEGPHANAKRALAVAFTSVSPNSIVVGIDRNSGLLLFHELEKTPLPKILEELEK